MRLNNNLMAVTAWARRQGWEGVTDSSDDPNDVCWKLKSPMFTAFVFSTKGVFRFEILNAGDEVVYEQDLASTTIEQAMLHGEQLLGEFLDIGTLVFQKETNKDTRLELKHAFSGPEGHVYGVGEDGNLYRLTTAGWTLMRMDIAAN